MTVDAPADITEIGNLPSASEDAAREAREQADAYDSVFGTTELELDDGSVVKIPPHPDYGMLDDDRMNDYTQLIFEVDTEYERHPDIYIPEQQLRNADGELTGITLPAETKRGNLKVPYRKLNPETNKVELVKPAHSIKVVIACLGEKEYDRLRAGGRSAADVWKIWADKSLKIKERQASDSKSAGGPVVMAPVPTPDSL